MLQSFADLFFNAGLNHDIQVRIWKNTLIRIRTADKLDLDPFSGADSVQNTTTT
jgi:hypothetical protein